MSIRKIIIPLFLILSIVMGILIFGDRQFTSTVDQIVSPDNKTRYYGNLKLRKLIPEERKALIPGLIEKLDDEDPHVRRFALYNLRQFGEKNILLAEKAVRFLRDPSEIVREEAIVLVTDLGSIVLPFLLADLPEYPPKTKNSLLASFTMLGQELIPDLVNYLHHPDSLIRQEASFLIWKMGDYSEGVIDNLISSLEDSSYFVRSYCALAVLKNDADEIKILPNLLEIISQNKWGDMQFEAVQGLGGFGVKAKKSLPLLMSAWERGKDGFRGGPFEKPAIAETLMTIDPRYTTPHGLIRDLHHKKTINRYRAAWTMGQSSFVSDVYVSALLKALDDIDSSVKARSVYAIGEIHIDPRSRFQMEILKKLLLLMNDEQLEKEIVGFHEMTAQTLSGFSSVLIPQTASFLQQNMMTTQAALRSLSRIESAVIENLKPYLEYGDPHVRAMAAISLARHDYQTPLIIGELKKAKLSKDKTIQVEANSFLTLWEKSPQ